MTFPSSKASHPTPRLLLWRLALLCCVLSPLARNTQADGPKATVRLLAEVVANGAQLKLGEVAEINAPDAATSERLRGIPLGYAPNVGAVRELARERIALAMAAAGFNAETALLTGPLVVRVRRASQLVTEETLRGGA